MPVIDNLKKAFRAFGNFMASVMNFVILTIVYIIGIIPTAIIGKLVRKKFLDTNLNEQTYWKQKKNISKNLEDNYKMS